MNRVMMKCVCCLAAVVLGGTVVSAEPVTLKNAVDPGPNKRNEPFAKEFSLKKGTQFLDSAALTWQKRRRCFSCHTNYAYLYARPLISSDVVAHDQVRKFAEQLVEVRWPKHKPRWDAEVVATAAALAFNDAATTKKLHPTTKKALDRMWTVQRKDGGWDWLKCDWPPMESDDHYGVTLAAIAVGVAPEKYVETKLAKRGLQGIQKYLKANPAPTVHHQAMTLWAATYVDQLMTAKAKKATLQKLLKLQRPDGGWNLPSMGNWERADGSKQDTKKSDGYATGFTIYVLRRAGVPAKHPAIRKGIGWLKSHQRQSGRWFTRSLHIDSRHYLTHAGTAFAMMALAECGEIVPVKK